MTRAIQRSKAYDFSSSNERVITIFHKLFFFEKNVKHANFSGPVPVLQDQRVAGAHTWQVILHLVVLLKYGIKSRGQNFLVRFIMEPYPNFKITTVNHKPLKLFLFHYSIDST